MNKVNVGLLWSGTQRLSGICAFLVQHGIDSISFNPDAIIKGIENIASAEVMIQHIVDIP